jgi:hypothetical protein
MSVELSGALTLFVTSCVLLACARIRVLVRACWAARQCASVVAAHVLTCWV